MVQEKMANWILVAGTIVAKGSDPASNSFHNFAPVLVGGPARHACADGTPKFDHYLMRKRSESLIDHAIATKRTKDLPPGSHEYTTMEDTDRDTFKASRAKGGLKNLEWSPAEVPLPTPTHPPSRTFRP
jgi:hypothetical protein